MSNQAFNINDMQVVELTNTLEKMHRSALPLAVRGTLNDAAFETRNKSIKRFNKQFIIRKRTLAKSQIQFNKCANTFDINQMESEAGVIRKNGNVSQGLKDQEMGGISKDREDIAMNPARVGKSHRKLVSKRYYMANIKGRTGRKMHSKQGYIRAAFKAGKGGFVLYKNILHEIITIRKTRGLSIKTRPVYSVEKGRSVKIKKTPYLAPSARIVAKQLPRIYGANAKRRIDKIKIR